MAVSACGDDHSDFFSFIVDDVISIGVVLYALNGICLGLFPLLAARVAANVFDAFVCIISVGFIDALHLQFCSHTFLFSFETSSTSFHFYLFGVRGITPFQRKSYRMG